MVRNRCVEALETEIENDRKNHKELTYLSGIYKEYIDKIRDGFDLKELLKDANEKYCYFVSKSYENGDDAECRKLIYDTVVSCLSWELRNE